MSGRRWSALLVGGLALLAGDTRAQEPFQMLLKPIAIFDSHLYAGTLLAPRGIAFDRRSGEVLVADTGNHLVGIFTAEGVPVFATGRSDALREPTRLVADKGGHLLVLDIDRTRIKRLSYRGEPLGALELPGIAEPHDFGAIAVDEDGNLYVGENESGQVIEYSPDLKMKLRFGSRGDEPGQFQSIAGIASDKDFIYVVDHRATPVQVFDRRGDLVRSWGRHDMGRENFSLPEAVVVDSKHRVIVVDALRHEIKFFDQDGQFLDRFGGLGARAGQVAFPADIAIDAQDHLYVVERGNSRVSVFEELEGEALKAELRRAPPPSR
ncbi:MAG TPA: NHL repeat-containing protein [Vicinamibacteria bacterium]|nr:NHL repeat-containing protein [Vicinamibacteria bacterium]